MQNSWERHQLPNRDEVDREERTFLKPSELKTHQETKELGTFRTSSAPPRSFLRDDLLFPFQKSEKEVRPPPGLFSLEEHIRRPKSAGVIGDIPTQNVGTISRPVPKTLMELIQEDCSPPVENNRPRSASPSFRDTPSTQQPPMYFQEQQPAQAYYPNAAQYVSIPVSQLQYAPLVYYPTHPRAVINYAVPMLPYQIPHQPHPYYHPQKIKPKKNSLKKKVEGPLSLLDEFRNTSKTRSWSIQDVQGFIVKFCFDQNGSRFLQTKLSEATKCERDIVLQECLPEIQSLQNDVFGNYVIQKLFESQEMHSDLYQSIKGSIMELSLQMYGCRIVQKAFASLQDTYKVQLLQEFHGHVMDCIHDQNGNHVIQKIIETCSQLQLDFLYDQVFDKVNQLSCHPYGCRVLQRMLEHSLNKRQLLDLLGTCYEALLDDQYGNYVIQHVLQYGRYQDREQLCQIVIRKDLLTLSKQKFASNVVEKLLKHGTPHLRKILVREMLQPYQDTTKVLIMVRDAYANYVVQTTLDVVPEGSIERTKLLQELNEHSSLLKNFTFAKHIVAKLN